MQESLRPDGRTHTQITRTLYAVIENSWELTKVLLRASERHGRKDYRGAGMALEHARGLLERMLSKLTSPYLAEVPSADIESISDYDA